MIDLPNAEAAAGIALTISFVGLAWLAHRMSERAIARIEAEQKRELAERIARAAALRAELDVMTETAITTTEEAVVATCKASRTVEQLRKHGIEAAVSVVLTADWAKVWVVVLPGSAAKLDQALIRMDLFEDDSRPRSQAGGWLELCLEGVSVPLFVLLDEPVPA